MSRTLEVWGERNFTIDVPDTAKVTFGPWSPPNAKGGHYGTERGGTLRIYAGKTVASNVIAVFSGVSGFRDTSLTYEELGSPPPLTPAIGISFPWSEMSKEEKEDLAEYVARNIVNKAADTAMAPTEDDDGLPPF